MSHDLLRHVCAGPGLGEDDDRSSEATAGHASTAYIIKSYGMVDQAVDLGYRHLEGIAQRAMGFVEERAEGSDVEATDGLNRLDHSRIARSATPGQGFQ